MFWAKSHLREGGPSPRLRPSGDHPPRQQEACDALPSPPRPRGGGRSRHPRRGHGGRCGAPPGHPPARPGRGEYDHPPRVHQGRSRGAPDPGDRGSPPRRREAPSQSPPAPQQHHRQRHSRIRRVLGPHPEVHDLAPLGGEPPFFLRPGLDSAHAPKQGRVPDPHERAFTRW